MLMRNKLLLSTWEEITVAGAVKILSVKTEQVDFRTHSKAHKQGEKNLFHPLWVHNQSEPNTITSYFNSSTVLFM